MTMDDNTATVVLVIAAFLFIAFNNWLARRR